MIRFDARVGAAATPEELEKREVYALQAISMPRRHRFSVIAL